MGSESANPRPLKPVLLGTAWAAASAGLLYWIILSAWRTHNGLLAQPQAALAVLALPLLVVIASATLALALMRRSRLTKLLAYVVTVPLSFFAVWALAWLALALWQETSAASLLGVAALGLALWFMHVTRQVAAELGANNSSKPTPLRGAA